VERGRWILPTERTSLTLCTGSFTCRRLYFPSQRKGALRTFIALKNPSPSAGFEPANLGSSGKLPPHPPRTTDMDINCSNNTD
jgi:hypothetical protein